MTKLSWLLAALILFGTSLSASPIYYYAGLSGADENPPTSSGGTGLALVTFDSAAHTLEINVAFSGLNGTTTAAHIHCCVAPPGNVAVATQTPTFIGFPLGVTSGAYSMIFDTTLASTYRAGFITDHGGTVATAEAALDTGLAGGQAYFNIHTTFAAGGEIRGFLAPVPEPATLSLTAAALTGLLLLRGRRNG